MDDFKDKSLVERQLFAMHLLGTWLQEDREAALLAKAGEAQYVPVLQRLDPIGLQAVTQAVANEWARRYGDDEEIINSVHRDAMRHELRKRKEKG